MQSAPSVQILCGDNLALMKSMPAQSVDLVFTSPPYEAARQYAELKFNLRGQEWVDWAVERFMECLRVCRGLVAWNVEGQTRDYSWSGVPMLMAADLIRRGVCLRKPPVFHRVGIPGSGGPDWLRNDYEFIVCGTSAQAKLLWSENTAMGHPPKWAPGGEMSNRRSNGTRMNQWGAVGGPRGGGNNNEHGNPKPTGRPSHKNAFGVRTDVPIGTRPTGNKTAETDNYRACDRTHTKRMADGEMVEQGYNVPAIANPGNVIRCIVGGGAMGSEVSHEGEAPFPEDLAEFFIRSFCPEGGTVLDPHSGTGTVAKVALKWGRNAIAIDIRESQCELTRKRIALESPALFTNGESRPVVKAEGEGE